jgi:hypothetical protein
VLVTRDGCDVLSRSVPTDPDTIEQMIRAA